MAGVLEYTKNSESTFTDLEVSRLRDATVFGFHLIISLREIFDKGDFFGHIRLHDGREGHPIRARNGQLGGASLRVFGNWILTAPSFTPGSVPC